MAPDAVTQSLLYASDANNGVVDVYKNYDSNAVKLEEQLTGFQAPYGECVDRSANVYIIDFNAQDVLEYAHGGTSPIKKLSVTGLPVGCAVDRRTENLAVAVYYYANPKTGQGGLFIFHHAAGTPTLYQDPDFQYYLPPGYDPHGNLFLEAQYPIGVTLEELRYRGHALKQISLGSTIIDTGGSAMWDGKYVAATDQQY